MCNVQTAGNNQKEMHPYPKRYIKNQKGFTFLESLFQLAVLLLLSQFISLIYIWFYKLDSNFEKDDVTWEMFIYELQEYIEKSEEIFLTNRNTVLQLKDLDTGETTQISRYGDMLRKQVDNKGHVPLFIGVKQVEFKMKEPYVTISVELLNGRKKERSLFAQNFQK